jgi:hypothetical protein
VNGARSKWARAPGPSRPREWLPATGAAAFLHPRQLRPGLPAPGCLRAEAPPGRFPSACISRDRSSPQNAGERTEGARSRAPVPNSSIRSWRPTSFAWSRWLRSWKAASTASGPCARTRSWSASATRTPPTNSSWRGSTREPPWPPTSTARCRAAASRSGCHGAALLDDRLVVAYRGRHPLPPGESVWRARRDPTSRPRHGRHGRAACRPACIANGQDVVVDSTAPASRRHPGRLRAHPRSRRSATWPTGRARRGGLPEALSPRAAVGLSKAACRGLRRRFVLSTAAARRPRSGRAGHLPRVCV